mmetsp:Transcript_43064/g.85300  ORF Transcript_43064/g.85300 Transcript_43064/m.85300 type:complete len:92 (+) Transcript_43064:160-435(+)
MSPERTCGLSRKSMHGLNQRRGNTGNNYGCCAAAATAGKAHKKLFGHIGSTLCETMRPSMTCTRNLQCLIRRNSSNTVEIHGAKHGVCDAP